MDSNLKIKPLVIRTSLGDTCFHHHEIIRIEADGCHTYIYNSDGEKLTSPVNITNMEKALPENVFFRNHRSHIVNLSFVSNINIKLAKLTVAGDEIPISETYRQKLIEMIESDKGIRYIR
jgi:two-component system, LytTR family, response regulator